MLSVMPRLERLAPASRVYLEKRRISLALSVLAGGVLLATILDRNPISSIPLLRTVSGVLGVVLAGLWGTVRLRNTHIRRGPMTWIVILMLLVVSLDIIRYLTIGHFAASNFLQWFQTLLLGLILVDIAKDYRAIVIMTGCVFIAILCVAALAVQGGTELGDGRVGADAFNLNLQAFYFGMTAIGSLTYLLARWPIVDMKVALAFALLSVSFAMGVRTGSRGGIAALIVGGGVVLLLMIRKRNITAYATLVPILLVTAVALFLSSGVADRWLDAFSGQDLGYRDIIWAASINLFNEAPFLGHGAGFIEPLGKIVRERNTSTHNQYLLLLVAYGVVALVLWFGLILSVLRRCWRYRSHPAAVGLIGMISASVIYGLSSDLMFSRYFWALLAIAANFPIVAVAYPNSARYSYSR